MDMKQTPSGRPALHYGWIIVITGIGVLFSCLGLGRFAIGMLLPSMGESLSLTYSQMGLISTGNFSGYMISVVLAGIIARAIGARKTIAAGLVLVGGSMMLIGKADRFMVIICLYVATGIGSGLANVPMMGLVSHWFNPSTRGRAAGSIISGNGIAIVFAGFFVPFVNTALGSDGWRTGWVVMGVLSLLVAVAAALFLRNSPAENGLTPFGASPAPAGRPKAEQKEAPDNSTKKTMLHLGLIYFLFGATYVVYATFIVTAMVKERGFGENTAGTFWAIVGGLSIFSGPLFGWLSDRLGRRTGMITVYLLFTLAYGLAAANLPDPFLFASIAIFGLAVWSIPTIMAAATGDYMGPEKAVKAFGFITLFFGAGQITGPAAAGYLADLTGSFNIAFGLCAVLTMAAAGLACFLKKPEKQTRKF
jgi:MFS family permease